MEEIPEELTEVIDNSPIATDYIPKQTQRISHNAPESSLFASAPTAPRREKTQVFGAGDCVIHKKFGRGIIISANSVGNDIHYEIAFESVGTKNLLGLYAKLEKGD